MVESSVWSSRRKVEPAANVAAAESVRYINAEAAGRNNRGDAVSPEADILLQSVYEMILNRPRSVRNELIAIVG